MYIWIYMCIEVRHTYMHAHLQVFGICMKIMMYTYAHRKKFDVWADEYDFFIHTEAFHIHISISHYSIRYDILISIHDKYHICIYIYQYHICMYIYT